MGDLVMLGSWADSLGFGLVVVLAVLGIECLVLARKSYLKAAADREDPSLLGAEFGIFSAPSAQLSAPVMVSRSCYLLLIAGGLALFTSLAVGLYMLL